MPSTDPGAGTPGAPAGAPASPRFADRLGRRLANAGSSLRIRNYRLYFTGQAISVGGTWMQTIAQAFLVLKLTGSGTQLGVVTAVRFVPMLFLGPWGGVVVDRLDKRRILVVTQALSAVLALAFGVLVGTGQIRMWLVYVLALLLGSVQILDNPARQSLIPELVPREQLGNAVLLNSITVNMARIIGAGVGGWVAGALGLATCFDLNAVSFAAVIITLLLMRSAQIEAAPRQPAQRGQVAEGFRYVVRTPELLIPLVMITVLGTLQWEYPVSLPLLASQTFHGGAATYGTMTAFMGLGGVVGGLLIAVRNSYRVSELSVTAIGWGIAGTLAAVAPGLPLVYAVMILVGFGSVAFNSLAKTSLQLATEPAMRGRVMALWALAWLGSTPIGGPIVGWVGEHVGARGSLLIGSIPSIVLGVVTLPILTRLARRPAPAVDSLEAATEPATSTATTARA
jgi:MFS family permease